LGLPVRIQGSYPDPPRAPAKFRSLVAHASARGEPIACALEPETFPFDGGRVVHSRAFICHEPVTGTTYEAQVATSFGQRWLI